jgi:hypothetical protein
MDRRFDKTILICGYRSYKRWVRDYTHPGLDIFDPDLCNTIVLRNWDLEFLGGGSEFWGSMELQGLVSKKCIMRNIEEVRIVKCPRTGEYRISKN